MKKTITLLSLAFTINVTAQNVGIGTTNPTYKLQVNSAGYGIIHSDLSNNVQVGTYVSSIGGWLGTRSKHNLHFFTNNSNPLLTLDTLGRFGVGTQAPSYIMDINGRARLRYNGNTPGIWYNKADNTEGSFVGMVNDSTYGFWGNGLSGNWKMGFDVKNAQMGIGLSNPTAPLSFASILGNKIALWGNATSGHYGLGVQGNLLQLYSQGAADDIALGYGNSTAFTENMRVKGNGNVGIGTNNPGAKLDVNGTVKITDGNQGDGKILTSDAAGNATWKSLPAASASVDISANNLNSSINLYSDTTTFLYGWNQIVESGGTNFDNTTGIYTVPVTGFYQINASVTWPPFPIVIPTSTLMLIVGLNNVRLAQTFSVSSPFNHTTIVSCGRRLTAGQKIRIGVYNGSASLLVFNNSIAASFSIALLHP